MIASLDKSMSSLHNPLAVPLTTASQKEIDLMKRKDHDSNSSNSNSSNSSSAYSYDRNRPGFEGSPMNNVYKDKDLYEYLKGGSSRDFQSSAGYAQDHSGDGDDENDNLRPTFYTTDERFQLSYDRSNGHANSLSDSNTSIGNSRPFASRGRSKSPISSSSSVSNRAAQGRSVTPEAVRSYTFQKSPREFAIDENFAITKELNRDRMKEEQQFGRRSSSRERLQHQQQQQRAATPTDAYPENEHLRLSNNLSDKLKLSKRSNEGPLSSSSTSTSTSSPDPSMSKGQSGKQQELKQTKKQVNSSSRHSNKQTNEKSSPSVAPTPLPSGFWRNSGSKYRVGGWKLQVYLSAQSFLLSHTHSFTHMHTYLSLVINVK
jgi:hypothetical protein